MSKQSTGAILAVLRQNKGMSREDVAKILGVESEIVCSWERGGCVPDAEALSRLSILFGVTEDALLGDPYEQEKTFTDQGEVKKIQKRQDLVKLICRSVALAMGMAVLVLSILERIEPQNAIPMLAIGMTCLGISSFVGKK